MEETILNTFLLSGSTKLSLYIIHEALNSSSRSFLKKQLKLVSNVTSGPLNINYYETNINKMCNGVSFSSEARKPTFLIARVTLGKLS